MDSLISSIRANRARYLDELAQFLAIPSVSTLASHAPDVRRCAEWTAGALQRAGLQNVRLFETPGYPIVYGDWLNAGEMPTVLCYGHYDVQPVDPLDRWESPPFEATVRNGNLYARGASDDKGQVFMHFKAIEAHLRHAGRLPVNVRVMVEGEEEVGGVHVARFVRDHKDLLAPDVVVISDGVMFDRGVPSVCYGLRGIACLQIDVRGTATDLHSGSFGGAVANPAFVLARILGRLKDATGRVAIPGFYDSVRELTAAERALLAALPFREDTYRESIGAPALDGEEGYTVLERVWGRPTCELNGILSGFTGEGTKTVIPATAMAKVSMRLVPDQDPDRIADLFEAFVRRIAPPTVDLTVTRMHGGRPWVTSVDHHYIGAAVRAIEKAFGVRPIFTREGGSNPLVATFQDVFDVPVVLFDMGLPDDNPHAPNEKLDLGNLVNGIAAAAYFYDELSRAHRSSML